MRRLRSLRTLIACAALALAAAADAAEITRVASSAEPDNPFDLDFSVRWDRTQRRAKITREFADPDTKQLLDATELRYEQISNAIVPRIAIGLYHDLELHAEAPYVLSDNHFWRYALVDGTSVEPKSSIANNAIDVNGGTCASPPCPIFPVGDTVYHGGQFGDLKMGITWGILSDRRDDTKPFWLVGVDVTMPTAERYDPNTSILDHRTAANQQSVGQKIWAYDLYTALSRRMGPIDPYVKAHVRIPQLGSSTYSNCDHVTELADPSRIGSTQPQMTQAALQGCPAWGSLANAEPPTVAGLTFGTEFVPYEDKATFQKVSIDLRASAEYVSAARWYNELSDATGKLLATEQYVTFTGLFGFYLRASEFVQLRALATLANDSSHLLTGEKLTKTGSSDTVPAAADQNPNFDWRYDPPGRRFRINEVSVFTVSLEGVINF